ncbi:hypothetical protein [Corynebacterium aquilae]|uniref:Uncharacterized protein n=1 Tax=Corynebacterium aquilae DSM 44791 TaxID=1431546 RepID=A0A1L7CDN5_9CORY|nr:hypothetical protein [Corynebacterium aquilae]APT83949.1 hypothetical protein CAQU_01415 [Corynebacterium aquilae DSM 44791]
MPAKRPPALPPAGPAPSVDAVPAVLTLATRALMLLTVLEVGRHIVAMVATGMYPYAQMTAIDEAGGLPAGSEALGDFGITVSLVLASFFASALSWMIIGVAWWALSTVKRRKLPTAATGRTLLMVYASYLAIRTITAFVPGGRGPLIEYAPPWVGLVDGLLMIAVGVCGGIITYLLWRRDVAAWVSGA